MTTKSADSTTTISSVTPSNGSGGINMAMQEAAHQSNNPANEKTSRRPSIYFESPTKFKLVDFKPGSLHDVFVSHISENAEFYVQMFVQRKFFEQMNFRLQVYYSTLDDADVMMNYCEIRDTPTLTNVWCAAPFTCDEKEAADSTFYHRARIIDRISPVTYRVFFVDYGNEAVVPFARLRHLPQTFRKVGPLAVRCTLAAAAVRHDAFRQLVESLVPGNLVLRVNSVPLPASIDDAAMRGARLDATLFLHDGINEVDVAHLLSVQSS